MPMTIDNIRYVYNGLQLLKDGYGSDAINHYKEFNSNTDLTPKDIAFGLGPQINSCGRMCNASLAVDYLFANDDDVEDLYNSIVKTNDERKAKTKKAIEAAEEMININKLGIVLNLSDVEGIAGIIASNVASKYRKPTIVFSQAGDVLIGSGRSDNINLLSVIKQIEANTDYIVKIGGHASACGITIKKQYFNDFCNALYNALEDITVVDNMEEQEELRVVVDDYITVSDINKDNCESLRSLYFFTESNPVFALNDITITKVKYSGNNPNNICFDIKDKTGSISTWAWGVGDMYKMLGEPKQVSIIAELDTKFGKPSLNILNIIPKGEIKYEK
jgi:single-stranded-DNA-specific exonuclease